jgi:cyanide hydratase
MPPASIRQYKAAVVQSEPGWFDLQRSVQMTVDLILEAGEKGCMLIAFPEICEHISKPIRRADTNTIKGFRGIK